MTEKLYQLKYITNGKIGRGGLAKLNLILHRLDQLLEQGVYCIVVDQNDVEYKAPAQAPKAIAAPKHPSLKPLLIDAIADHLKKPENIAKRRQVKLEDDAMWAKLRNS